MTIAEQAKMVLGALQELVKATGGRAFMAADPIDCIEQLRMKPGVPAYAVLWQTEEPYGEYEEMGKVQRGFKVIVSRGRSMKLQPGESLIEGAAGGEPMFNLVEMGRETVLALRMKDEPSELQLPVYKGSGPFEVNGLVLDATEIRFGLFAQITVQVVAN